MQRRNSIFHTHRIMESRQLYAQPPSKSIKTCNCIQQGKGWSCAEGPMQVEDKTAATVTNMDCW
jgi:hypothetical protein